MIPGCRPLLPQRSKLSVYFKMQVFFTVKNGLSNNLEQDPLFLNMFLHVQIRPNCLTMSRNRLPFSTALHQETIVQIFLHPLRFNSYWDFNFKNRRKKTAAVKGILWPPGFTSLRPAAGLGPERLSERQYCVRRSEERGLVPSRLGGLCPAARPWPPASCRCYWDWRKGSLMICWSKFCM